MRKLVLVVLISGCRYLAAPMPEVTPENPALLSNGNPTDTTRQVQPPSRKCIVACSVGYVCNEDGVCEPPKTTARAAADGGPAWLEGVGSPHTGKAE